MANDKKSITEMILSDDFLERFERREARRTFYIEWSLKFLFAPTMLVCLAISLYIMFAG